MNRVMKATKTDKGIVVHELDNGETRKYLAVRGGISWPLLPEKLPPYFCIYGEKCGEENRFDQSRRGRLSFLCEYESDISMSLTTFLTKITDAVTLYECGTFYTLTEISRGEDYRGYAEAFQKFMLEKGAKAWLEEAPWQERPDLGIHHIHGWNDRGLLEIPEGSLIRSQLQTLQADKVKTLPEMFNAINALRFVVCGFEKDKPPRPTQKIKHKGTWQSA